MSRSHRDGFQAIPTSELSEREERRQALQSSSETRSWILSSFITLILSSIIFIVLLVPGKPTPKSSCGQSIEEATSLGCQFDELVGDWLPPDCSRIGSAEYLAFGGGSWDYWADQNGTTPTPDLSKLSGGSKWWTTDGAHLAHCAFMLVRVADAYHNGLRIDEDKAGNMNHTWHCARFLLNAAMKSPDIKQVRSVGYVGFGTC